MITVEFFADDEGGDELDRDPFGSGPLLPPLDPAKCAFPYQHPLHSRTISAICDLFGSSVSSDIGQIFEKKTNDAAFGIMLRSGVRNWKAEAEILSIGIADPIELLRRYQNGQIHAGNGSLACSAIELSSSGRSIEFGDGNAIGGIVRYADELRGLFNSSLSIANENSARRGPRKMDHLDGLIDWCCSMLGPDRALPSNQDIEDSTRKTKLLCVCEVGVRVASAKASRCLEYGSPMWRDNVSEVDKTARFYYGWSTRALVSRIRERLSILGAGVSN